MSFHFKTADLDREMRRIAEGRLTQALIALEHIDPIGGKGVHDARKCCKKTRGMLRLLRPGLDKSTWKANRILGDAASHLGASRDACVRIQTLDDLLSRYAEHINPAGFLPLKTFLDDRLTRSIRHLPESVDVFRHQVEAVRDGVDQWVLLEPGPKIISDSLAQSYGRGRNAMNRARDKAESEAFHDWRKRAKAVWYGLRILQAAWPERLKAEAADFKQLDAMLGEHNDIATLLDEIEFHGDHAFESDLGRHVLRLIADHRCERLRSKAHALGKRLFAEKPGGFGRRLAAYWEIWRKETALASG